MNEKALNIKERLGRDVFLKRFFQIRANYIYDLEKNKTWAFVIENPLTSTVGLIEPADFEDFFDYIIKKETKYE